MQITRSQSTVLAVSSIALFFLVGFLFLKRDDATHAKYQTSEQSLVKPTLVPATASDASRFSLNEFHRTETKNGRVNWEIKATQGKYYPEDNTAGVSQAKLWYYRPDGAVIELSAPEALLHLTGVGVSSADLLNGVRLVYDQKVTIETEKAIYDKVNNAVDAPGQVTIKSKMIEVVGSKMHADLETQTVLLSNGVKSVINPGGGNAK